MEENEIGRFARIPEGTMNLSPTDHLVLAHYEGRWGKPTNIHAFDKPQVPAPVRPLYIAEFFLPTDRLTIYTSIGMSRAPMSLRTSSPSHRVEVYLGTLHGSPALPEVMAMLAAYPHLAQTFVGVEHTIPIGDPIVPNSGMTAVLLSLPYFEPPEFGQINLREYHVQVLWVIPLYESERQFKIQQGWNALRQVFEQQHVAIGDLMRKPVV